MAGQARLVAVIAAAALVAGCNDDDVTSQRDCGMPFAEYDAGPEVAGFEREAVTTNCGSRPFVSYVYGTCEASGDSGCAPPLEIQTASYCHFKPSRVSATDFGVRRGPVTVKILATSRRVAESAVPLLRKARSADASLPLTRKLRACGAR